MAAIGIIGMGLIGSSVARGVREAGLYDEIVGFDRDSEALEAVLAGGFVDRAAPGIEALAGESALVLIAVPTRAIESCLEALARSHHRERLVISDTGSVKGSVIEGAARAFGELPSGFVPGHPIAGSERSGSSAGDAKLFRGRKVILTPTERTSPEALSEVERLWRGLGARVEHLPAGRHDRLLAMTSHLPHLLAYALVDTLASRPESEELLGLAAGGLRDFTRIASSNPEMWRDIFLDNSEALLEALDAFESRLGALRQLVEKLRSEDILALCERAREVRDRHLKRG